MTKPEEMAARRYTEFAAAMTELGFGFEVLQLPDLGLSFVDFATVVHPLLQLFRSNDFAAVFAFSPTEYTWMFDHPDHTKSGEAARFAAMATDVGHYEPKIPATKNRPELYLRTTNSAQATHKLTFSGQMSENRNEYLIHNYPSQFSEENKKEWSRIFDEIYSYKKKKRKKKQKEYYQRIR